MFLSRQFQASGILIREGVIKVAPHGIILVSSYLVSVQYAHSLYHLERYDHDT